MYGITQSPSYHYIWEYSLGQVLWIFVDWVTTSDQYIFFLIFRMAQTSRN